MAGLADIQSDFDWDEYLRLLGPDAGSPAPPACFKQTADPPGNRFVIGYRLESRDPRNPDNTCIASVVDLLGPRLRLRLDGSDDRNDFYRLVDSEDLFPHPSGRFIVPPLGFAKSINYWPGFLEKVKASGNFAPAECFVRTPTSPAKNYFCVGHKLEAIDRKNPLFVCPATVKEVRQDRIFVSFDGWRGAFDYWCRYDCRDIFPVGWCRRAGYPVQPPGSRAPQQQPQQLRTRYKQVSGGSTPSPGASFSDKSAAASPQLPVAVTSAPQHSSQPAGLATAPAPPMAAPGDASAPVSVRARPSAASPSQFSADTLRQRFADLAGSDGVCRGPPGQVLRDLLQACLDASRVPARALARMPRCGGGGGGDPAVPLSVVVGPADGGRRPLRRVLPLVDSSAEFWRLLGEFLSGMESEGLFADAEASDEEPEAAEDVVELPPSIVVQLSPPDAVGDVGGNSIVAKESPKPSPAPTPTSPERSRPTTPASASASTTVAAVSVTTAAAPVVPAMLATSAPLRLRTGSLDGDSASASAAGSATTVSSSVAASTSGAAGLDAAGGADENGASAAKMARLSDPCVMSAPSADMSEWSVLDVSQFLRDSGLGSLVPLFADQAIDGAALLLLNTQAMMKFMGVKLGPALKLLSFVEKAKRRLSLLHSMRTAYRHS